MREQFLCLPQLAQVGNQLPKALIFFWAFCTVTGKSNLIKVSKLAISIVTR